MDNCKIKIGNGNCSVCNNAFEIFKNNPNKKYCSSTCGRKGYYEENKKKESEKNKQWYASHKEYEFIKNKEYRENNKELFDSYKDAKRFGGNRKNTIERDGGKCCACGNDNNLAVHHKNNCGYTDIPENNALDNLITLCNSCHAKLHSWQRKHNIILLNNEDILKVYNE